MVSKVGNISDPKTYSFISKYSALVDEQFTRGRIACQSMKNQSFISVAHFQLHGEFVQEIYFTSLNF